MSARCSLSTVALVGCSFSTPTSPPASAVTPPQSAPTPMVPEQSLAASAEPRQRPVIIGSLSTEAGEIPLDALIAETAWETGTWGPAPAKCTITSSHSWLTGGAYGELRCEPGGRGQEERAEFVFILDAGGTILGHARSGRHMCCGGEGFKDGARLAPEDIDDDGDLDLVMRGDYAAASDSDHKEGSAVLVVFPNPYGGEDLFYFESSVWEDVDGAREESKTTVRVTSPGSLELRTESLRTSIVDH